MGVGPSTKEVGNLEKEGERGDYDVGGGDGLQNCGKAGLSRFGGAGHEGLRPEDESWARLGGWGR